MEPAPLVGPTGSQNGKLKFAPDVKSGDEKPGKLSSRSLTRTRSTSFDMRNANELLLKQADAYSCKDIPKIRALIHTKIPLETKKKLIKIAKSIVKKEPPSAELKSLLPIIKELSEQAKKLDLARYGRSLEKLRVKKLNQSAPFELMSALKSVHNQAELTEMVRAIIYGYHWFTETHYILKAIQTEMSDPNLSPKDRQILADLTLGILRTLSDVKSRSILVINSIINICKEKGLDSVAGELNSILQKLIKPSLNGIAQLPKQEIQALTVHLPKIIAGTVSEEFKLAVASDLREASTAIFKSIRPEELANAKWVTNKASSPSVLQSIRFTEDVSHFIQDMILHCDKKEERANVISFWIQVATITDRQLDRQTSQAIVLGLTLNSISRLKQTWASVSPAMMKQFEILETQYDASGKGAAIQASLIKQALESHTPLIPYISRILNSLALIHEANPAIDPRGEINLVRLSLVAKIQEEISRLQEAITPQHLTLTDISDVIHGKTFADDDEYHNRSTLLEKPSPHK